MTTRKLGRTLLVAALALSLVLSITGGTIAWFTDEVTSANNEIKAGNLDITLDYFDVAAKEFKPVTENIHLFNQNAKWEPGHTEVAYLKVSNAGTLALKYHLAVTIASETESINKAGETFKLSDHLVFKTVGITEADVNVYTRQSAQAAAGNILGLNYNTFTGEIKAKEAAEYVALIAYMPETVGNEANHKAGVAAPSINLGVKLTATQMMDEADSFGNDYDAGATLPVVSNFAGLKAALENGESVILGKDVTASNPIFLPADSEVEFNLGGQKLTGSILAVDAQLAVENGSISNPDKASSAIEINEGELTLKNVNIESARHAVRIDGPVTATIDGGTYKAAVGTGTGTYHAVNVSGNANVTINGGTFIGPKGTSADSGSAVNVRAGATVVINGGNFSGGKLKTLSSGGTLIVKGGTFDQNPSAFVPAGYEVTNNGNGTWTVSRKFADVTITPSADKAANGDALANAISNITNDAPFLQLPAGEYKMPSVGVNKEVTIVGTKDTVIDVTMGAYMESSKVSFEGVTIKGSTGMVNGNGSDYAALYTPNVTYTNCTFDGPFRIGRDGATFINCTFTNLGNDYVWTYGNDATFKNCTFNSEGKALLIYSDGGNEVSKVVVENCTFNATKGAKAGAIANQNCAAIEIDNYGNGVNLTANGNTYNDTYFSGEWRIKNYATGGDKVIVNDTEYTTIALDGKTMTKDASNNVTLN